MAQRLVDKTVRWQKGGPTKHRSLPVRVHACTERSARTSRHREGTQL